MNVPFANITQDERETYIEGESVEAGIRKNIDKVLDKKDFILGAYVSEFETAFAKYCGAKHCVGVGNGLSALELALIGIGIEKGDEVITVANTFNATVAAIAKLGAKVKLVDANYQDSNMDLSQLKSAISKNTKAIMPVHLYGQIVEMDKLEEIAQDIPIVEDACQAHGAVYNGRKAGGFGTAGCFSFYPGKNLGAYGDGGAIVTNSDRLAEFLKKTRNYGQTKKYCHDIRPDNSRLDTIQAAVLVEKLKVLDRWNSMRMENSDIYRENLSGIEEIKIPSERKRGEHIYHLFVIKAEKRDELESYLSGKGIQTGKHYPVPIHMQECFYNLGYKKGDFPASEKLSDSILTLPMFPTLKKEEIEHTARSLKEFYFGS
jgi:dTDP-4-amino-4,6-dideoxygalactose transaminase